MEAGGVVQKAYLGRCAPSIFQGSKLILASGIRVHYRPSFFRRNDGTEGTLISPSASRGTFTAPTTGA